MNLKGKKALILGVANDRSIAWAIAKALHDNGAEIALTYQGEALKKRVEPLAEQIDCKYLFEVDVTSENQLKQLKKSLESKWENFDILVHSIAFADRDDLKARFIETSREGFLKALEISAYSLVGLCGSLEPLLNPGGSVMAMTYYGSQKVIPNYNIMGVAKAALESSVRYLACDLGQKRIRINAISAGPIKTLAASGVSGFRSMLSQVEEKAPLKENITQEDVGQMALYLASDLSRRVTGQTFYVDAGLSILGL